MTPRFTRIAFRLPAIVILAAALAAIAIGGFSYFESASEVRHQEAEKLVSLRASRHAALTQYFRSIEEDLELYAASAHVAAALEAFTPVFSGIGPEMRDQEERALRGVYSRDHGTGRADRLASDGTPLTARYFQLHSRFHNWFQFTHEVRGYYDLFLVSPAGDVVYSAFKEADFASNLVGGKWSQSGLAKAFAGAMNSGQAFADFEPYAPSIDAPAAFIARKIVRNGRTLGVLALQMPIGRINEVMQVTAGMGKTGETYIVGPDFLMRSDSRFSETSTILETRVETGTARRALAGENGVDIVDDYRGVPVLSAFQPFEFGGTTWAVMAEIDIAEVDTPIDTMRNSIVFIGIGLTLLVALGGVVLAGSITKPLAELSRSITEFRETRKSVDLSKFPGHDEIAEIARGFQSTAQEVADYISARAIAEQELETQRAQLNVILTNIRQGIVLFDKDQRIVTWNAHYPDILNIDEADLKSGMTLHDLTSRIAERGDYGEGDPADLARQRVEKLWAEEFRADASFGGDRSYDVHSNRTPDGGLVISYIDITERKKAEQQIEIQRAQLNDVLTNIRQGIVLFDSEKRIVTWNAHYPDILNFDEADLKAGMTLDDVVYRIAERGDLGDGDPAELARKRVENLWEGDVRTDVSFDDQRSIDVHANRTPDGGLLISYIDITDRKQAEQLVAAQRAQLDDVLRNIHQGVVKFDKDQRLVAWNAKFPVYFGIEKEYLEQGVPLYDLALQMAKRGVYGDGDPKQLARERIEKIWVDEFRADISSDDGSSFDVHGNRTPDGGLVITYADITDRKKAEEALKESEVRFRNLYNVSPVMMHSIGPTGELLRVNDFWLRRMGYERDEVIGRKSVDFMTEESREFAVTDRLPAFRSKGYCTDAPYQFVTKDGELIDVLLTAIAEKDDDGNFVRSFAVLVDITERKKAEAEIVAKEKLLRTALENMPGAMWLVDQDMKLVFANDQYKTLCGDPGGIVVPGTPIADILKQEAEGGQLGSEGTVDEILAARIASYESSSPSEFEDRSPDGGYILITRRPTNDGQVISVAVDVSARKEAERQLKDAYDVISDSIQYASNIQRSLLPPEEFLAEDLADHFVIWEPRDVVGGDLYWYRRTQDRFVIALADCTGHGVPGAFMTMLSTGALDRALRDHPDGDPAELLPLMNRSIKHFLGQNDDEGASDDGLELGICRIDTVAGKLVFAGARFSLFQVNGAGIEEIKGDKSGIGYRRVPPDQAFTNHEVALENGDTFYMTTDGLTDQIGGEKRSAFGKRRFLDVVASVQNLPMAGQKEQIAAALNEYQGDEARRDVVAVIGFRLERSLKADRSYEI